MISENMGIFDMLHLPPILSTNKIYQKVNRIELSVALGVLFIELHCLPEVTNSLLYVFRKGNYITSSP